MSKKSNRKKQLEKKAKQLKRLKKDGSGSQEEQTTSQSGSGSDGNERPQCEVEISPIPDVVGVSVLADMDTNNNESQSNDEHEHEATGDSSETASQIPVIITPRGQRFIEGDHITDPCPPQFRVLATQYKGKYCDGCFAPPIGPLPGILKIGPLRPCSGCHLNWYCSKSCQHQDWHHAHKLECGSKFWKDCVNKSTGNNWRVSTGHLLNQDSWKPRLFRAHSFVKLDAKHGKATEPFQVWNTEGDTTTFKELLDTFPKISLKSLPPLMPTVREFKEFAKQWAKDEKDEAINLEYVVRLYRFLDRFTIQIPGDLLDSSDLATQKLILIGYGTYAQLSSVNQGCKGNINLWTRPITGILVVTALLSIYDGESIVYSFHCDTVEPKEMRQKYLKDKGILDQNCDCDLCSSDIELSFDYRRLNALTAEYKSMLYTKPSEDPSNWGDIVDLTQTIVKMLNLLFNTYDPKITELCYRLLKVGKMKQIGYDELEEHLITAKLQIMVTYGSLHYYNNLIEVISESAPLPGLTFTQMTLKNWLVNLVDKPSNTGNQTKEEFLSPAPTAPTFEEIDGERPGPSRACGNKEVETKTSTLTDEDPVVMLLGDLEPGGIIQLNYQESGKTVNYRLEDEPCSEELDPSVRDHDVKEGRALAISQLKMTRETEDTEEHLGNCIEITQCQLIGFGPKPGDLIQLEEPEPMEIGDEAEDGNNVENGSI